MPELPDLQVFSGNLKKLFAGKTVKSVNAPVFKKIKPGLAEIRKSLKGAKLNDVYREGKELRFAFEKDVIIGMHLMLHGGMAVTNGNEEARHTIFNINFDDGTSLALTDWQKQAAVTLNPEESEAPDALSKKVNFSFLKRVLNKKSPVKTVLMDQEIIRGIGNAYADEILWKAGISPFSAANKIPPQKLKTLATTIKTVLKDAVKKIQKEKPGIISGVVREFLTIPQCT